MKKQFFSFLILLSLVLSVSAQKAQTPKPDLTERNLRKHVAYLAADRLEGRRTGEQGATFAAGYAANVFAQYKLKSGARNAGGKLGFLQMFPYTPRDEKGDAMPNAATVEAYNVVGILEGTDAVLKNEAIVVGAHYDHLGKGGTGSLAANSTAIHHGADDNASGVAAMLEMARRFAAEKKNKRTIVFVAFGGEEEGLLGSRFYINNPAFPLDKTVAMINLDMVGRLNENKLTVGGIGTANEWRDLVNSNNFPNAPLSATIPPASPFKVEKADKNGETISKTYSNFALQLNEDGFGPSDHSSFYAKQIPVLFFFTGTHADYHKPTDTAEKINYEGLLKITHYVSEIVKAIDRNPKRPTYAVAKSSGMGGSRASFNVTIGVVPAYGESNDGLLLDGVRDGSPAAAAGIRAGDKVVRFAGEEIRNISDYTRLLGKLKADAEYEIEVVRGSERLTLKVKPAARK
ncbi:MAG TPA: M20/M25/M40 family metallo-hydrolase [Pyrinomonadaceae bacterium]|nr:M20/M25/M40 family metallo-hydrolase [Pyrinomonadaceae bacterium]